MRHALLGLAVAGSLAPVLLDVLGDLLLCGARDEEVTRARHAADAVGATGWVHNEYDGTVTMEIQGTEEQIDRVILMIGNGTFVHIDNMEAKTIPIIDGERSFKAK